MHPSKFSVHPSHHQRPTSHHCPPLQVDAIYSGSQKCLSAPPGAAPLMLNDRALEKVRSRKTKVGGELLGKPLGKSHLWGRWDASLVRHVAGHQMACAVVAAMWRGKARPCDSVAAPQCGTQPSCPVSPCLLSCQPILRRRSAATTLTSTWWATTGERQGCCWCCCWAERQGSCCCVGPSQPAPGFARGMLPHRPAAGHARRCSGSDWEPASCKRSSPPAHANLHSPSPPFNPAGAGTTRAPTTTPA